MRHEMKNKQGKLKTIKNLDSKTEERNTQLIVTGSGFVNVMPQNLSRDERTEFLNSCR